MQTYIVSNLSKKIHLKMKMEVAKTRLQQMRGLMFRKEIIPMLFIFESEGKHPIHSFFVPACFDAIYLSKEFVVREIFRRIQPNTLLICPSENAKFLLELPCKLSSRLKIEVGDVLRLEEC
ncbi:MAG: DUF192 domain-containing protein [Candidatus Anstonellaceae archaeon]